MFRFRLGRIPVEVHFSHLLFSALIAYGVFRPTRAGLHWPANILGDAAHPEYSATLAVFMLGWILVIFLSVLVHEMGHALVSLAYGYRPTVSLEWMGGHTNPNPNETIPWHKDVLLTLAGPLFGFSLGVLSLGLELALTAEPVPLSYFLKMLFWSNLAWTILNLLPVAPLDGGRVATRLSMRLFGRPGFLVAQVLAVVCSLGVVLYLAAQSLRGNLFIIVFFAMFGSRALALIAAYFRGEAPVDGPSHPSELALGHALERFRVGHLDDADKLATAALGAQPAPRIAARLHHLLGWIAVKRGEGRAALDHFSQVHGQKVEPQALAAAFSLVGDDARALTLWELAYRETLDATILHEWAGALVREGQRDSLSRLPAPVKPSEALHFAERVLFIRGEYERAAELAVEAVDLEPSAERAYDAACALAKAGKLERAVEMLHRAQSLGFQDVEYALSDADLTSLHTQRGFQEWALALQGKRRGMTKP